MDQKLLIILATALLATSSFMSLSQQNVEDHHGNFVSFQAKHGKAYATQEEEAYRFAVYTSNVAFIAAHNTKNGETYSMAENQFTDLTHEEFKAHYLGYLPKDVPAAAEESVEYNGTAIDWVSAGKVQKVKDQGQCGSCWAFSTAASSESLKAIRGGAVGDFSEQQLVDCSTSYGNQGCNGGLMDYGFSYYKDHGICTESSYSYTAADGSCKASSCTKDSFTLSGYTDVSGVSSLTSALASQPVSVAVDAQNWSFYSSGVFSNCGSSLDHGVLLTGISSSGVWTIKNSWGASWGENGFIRLQSGNTCGLANQPSVPK